MLPTTLALQVARVQAPSNLGLGQSKAHVPWLYCNVCYPHGGTRVHMPQIEFAMGTAESTAKVRNSGMTWGMCSKHCETCPAIADLKMELFSFIIDCSGVMAKLVHECRPGISPWLAGTLAHHNRP